MKAATVAVAGVQVVVKSSPNDNWIIWLASTATKQPQKSQQITQQLRTGITNGCAEGGGVVVVGGGGRGGGGGGGRVGWKVGKIENGLMSFNLNSMNATHQQQHQGIGIAGAGSISHNVMMQSGNIRSATDVTMINGNDNLKRKSMKSNGNSNNVNNEKCRGGGPSNIVVGVVNGGGGLNIGSTAAFSSMGRGHVGNGFGGIMVKMCAS